MRWVGRGGLRWPAALLCAGALAIMVAVWSSSRENDARRGFARQFVASVHDDTGFWKEHAEAGSQGQALEVRQAGAGEFALVHEDSGPMSLSSDEFYFRFSNGAVAVVYVHRVDGALRGAAHLMPPGSR